MNGQGLWIGRRVAAIALATVGLSLVAGGRTFADSHPEDDRVRLDGDRGVVTTSVVLSAEQVSVIRRAIFALRPKIGLGLAPACTGTAISETLILTAGHCVDPGGMKAYQKHLEPRPHSVGLKLVHRLLDKRSGADIALYARESGTFTHYLPVDTRFDFTKLEPGDRFGFPAFPYEMWHPLSWRQTKLLFSPVTRSLDRGREVWFDVRPCRGDPPRSGHDAGPSDPEPSAGTSTVAGVASCCQVRFRAAFYAGNSGSPMLRFHRENGAEAMTVVAVGTVGAEPTAPDGSLGSAAAPTSLLREVLPALGARTR